MILITIKFIRITPKFYHLTSTLIILFILFLNDAQCQVFITPLSEKGVTFEMYVKNIEQQFPKLGDASIIKIFDKEFKYQSPEELFNPDDMILIKLNNEDYTISDNRMIKFIPGDKHYNSYSYSSGYVVRDDAIIVDTKEKELKTIVGASGGIKSAISNPGNNTSATGTLEIRFEKPFMNWGYQITGSVGVLATDDTINSNYGASLLIPQTGRNSALFDLAYYRLIDRNIPLIIRVYSYISTTTWLGNINDSSYSEDGSIFGAGASVGLQIFGTQDDNKKNNAALTFSLGLAYRSILGDLSSNTYILQNFLNSESDNWIGVESGFMTYFKGINVGISYYYFFGNDNIPGLSNGQVTGGVSFSIDLIEF